VTLNDLEGRTLGRYRLIERVGGDLLFENFQAKSFGVEGFEKTLLVKRLRPELASDPAFSERFVHEAKRSMRLSHMNLVQVLDLGCVETGTAPVYYLVTELVAGLSLSQCLQRRPAAEGGLPEAFVLHLAAQVCKALDHAHRRRDHRGRPLGLVHGALHPGSILLSYNGEVKISDFCLGLALLPRLAGDAAEAAPREFHALKRYLGPEQLDLGRAEPASDLYALGVILRDILRGAPPPSADAERTPVQAPLSIDDGIGEATANAINGLLQTELATRTQSASELYEELLACQYSLSTRFGPAELSDFVGQFREAPGAPESLDELLRTYPPSPEELVEEAPDPPPVEPTPFGPGQHHELSTLVLRFQDEAPSAPEFLDQALDILSRDGATLVARSERELCTVFGLQRADGRDLEHAARGCLAVLRAAAGAGTSLAAGLESDRVLLLADDPGSIADALSDSQRAARRLCRTPGCLRVSERAARALAPRFELGPPDAEGVREVVSARPALEAYGRFVGRKAELSQVGQKLLRASQHEFSVLGITGPSGIGKTRLLWEVKHRIDRDPSQIACTIATCPAQGRTTPYAAAVAMLRTLCGVSEGDTQERIESVGPRLRGLGLRDEQVGALLRELGLNRAPSSGESNLLQSAMTQVLQSLAEDRLHLFVWDDAEEMDPQSRELIAEACARLQGQRAMIVLAARDSADAELRALPGLQILTLGDLDDDDAFRLIGTRIRADEVPERLFEFVRQRAGGHPMFIEELLREAVESGAVVVRDRRVQSLRTDGALSIPRPLRALLGDRVRRLPARERELLTALAILDAPAEMPHLARMLDTDVQQAQALCQSLEALEILGRDGNGPVRFRTPLLAEVVLAEVEPEARAELHRRAAASYRALSDSIQHADRVGRHLAEAGLGNQAAAFFAESGLSHLTARRFERAKNDLQRALDLADFKERSPELVAGWFSALAAAVPHAPAGDGLHALVQRIQAWFESSSSLEPSALAGVRLAAAQMLSALHYYREARALLQKLASDAGMVPAAACTARLLEAEVAIEQGELEAALGLLSDPDAMAAATPAEQRRRHLLEAQALAGAGRIDAALASLDAAQAAMDASDPLEIAELERSRARVLAADGRLQDAVVAADRAKQQALSAGSTHQVSATLHLQATALVRLGELPRAYAAFQAALAAAEELGAERLINDSRMWLAYLDARNGRAGADGELGECLGIAERRRWTADAGVGRLLLGKLFRHRGQAGAAERELRLALELAEANKQPGIAQDCRVELEELLA